MNETRRIADIVVGQRYRQELGDIATLAESIRNVGLLHPIGITHDNELIFGERRLRAAQSLGWTEIAASVIDIASIATGQYHENEMRKDFTVSERVAILETIQRHSHGGDRGNQYTGGKRQAEDLPFGTFNREQAVRRAGLGNTTSAREAGCIVKQGIPALVEAVDRGEIAVEPGFAIARQSPERQAEIIKMPVFERRAVVRELERPGKHVNSRVKPNVSDHATAISERSKAAYAQGAVSSKDIKHPQDRTVTVVEVIDALRPLVRRVKEQSRQHPVMVSQASLAIIASAFEMIFKAWAQGDAAGVARITRHVAGSYIRDGSSKANNDYYYRNQEAQQRDPGSDPGACC